ncbi:hypothetical protein HDU93_009499, partial [Gonapodya sp. JEL0774]
MVIPSRTTNGVKLGVVGLGRQVHLPADETPEGMALSAERLDDTSKSGAPEESKELGILREVVGYGGSGLVFGGVLQKGRVYEPHLIQSQMLLTDFTMATMFLAAVATSQVVFAVAELADVTLADGTKFRAVRKAYQKDRGARGVVAVAVGSAVLGSGFALAGACPGTVYAQLGAQVPGSYLVLLGGAVGIAAVTVLDPVLQRGFYKLCVAEKLGLEHHLSTPYPTLAITSAVVMSLVVVFLEKYAPTSHGYGSAVVPLVSVSVWESLIAKAWTGWAAGALIGLLQVPSMYFANQPLGTSSAFVALLSPLSAPLVKLGLIDAKSELGSTTFPSKKAYLHILQLLAMVIGSAVAGSLSGTTGTAAGLTGPGIARTVADKPVAHTLGHVFLSAGGAAQAILGGFALFFGARMAKGCTSGHGISGFGLLNTVSMVAVPAMFAGGIVTAKPMGVPGLRIFLDSLKIPRHVNLAQLAKTAFANASSNAKGGVSPKTQLPAELLEIVVDGPALIRRLYSSMNMDWIRGGQWEYLYKSQVTAFVKSFTKHGFRLTVFFDGKISEAKRKTWILRRLAEQKRVVKIVNALDNAVKVGKAVTLPRKNFMAPMSSTRVIADAFSALGCKVLLSFGECDRELAHYAISNRSFAVLADDSDFCVWDVARVLSIEKLDYAVSKTTVVEREKKEEVLGLTGQQIAWLATLAGNDYIASPRLARFHRTLIKRHYPSPPDPIPDLPSPAITLPALVAFLRATPVDNVPAIVESMLAPTLLAS